ncbi:hypothetical protein ACFX13_042693 [Malus domestica]
MSQTFRCNGCTSVSKTFDTIEGLRIHVHDRHLATHYVCSKKPVCAYPVYSKHHPHECVATHVRTPTKNELKKKRRSKEEEGVGTSEE